MRSTVPSWLQFSRGTVAAVSLLLVLLVAVPGVVSLSRETTPQPPSATDDEASSSLSPPASLSPVEPDWMATADASIDPTREERSHEEGPLDCLIQPSEMIEIGSQTTGLIVDVLVERGDRVEAGQVVVELEAEVERAAVEVAAMRSNMKGALRAREATVELSQNRKKRSTELFEQNAVSVDMHEELETQARLAELQLLEARESIQLASLELRQAQALLRRRSLRSPIAGVVMEQALHAGEIVDEETVLTVATIDPLRVDVLMRASRFGTISPGMRASIEPEFPAEASVVAEVTVVDPVIDAASGTFNVRLDLPNPEGRIPGGLHCTVKFLDR